MDIFASSENNTQKWQSLHKKSSNIKVRTTPNLAIAKILDLKQTFEFDSVLEVGCGFGRNLAFLIKNHYAKKYYGIDITDTSINKCCETLSDLKANVKLEVGNAGKSIKSPNDFYDVVFDIMSAITFISDDNERKQYFSEISRVLKPGGHYYFLCARKEGVFHDVFEDSLLLQKGFIKRKLDGMLEKVYTEDELIRSFPNFENLKLQIVSEHTRAFGDEKFIREEGFLFGDFKKKK